MEVSLLPRVRPLGWLLERLVVRRQMQADVARSIGRLKRLVEQERTERA
jgi:hypothetical protein